MTTPSTAQVREWARSQGIDVADRGRLPDELRAAHLKANDAGSTTTDKTAEQAVSSRAASGAGAGATSSTMGHQVPPGRRSVPAQPTASLAAPRQATGTPTATGVPTPVAPAQVRSATTVAAPLPERLVVQPPVPRRTGGRPARPATRPTAAPAGVPAEPYLEADPAGAPPADSPVRDERLDQLEAQVAALAERVAALEGASAKAKPSFFRRRQS